MVVFSFFPIISGHVNWLFRIWNGSSYPHEEWKVIWVLCRGWFPDTLSLLSWQEDWELQKRLWHYHNFALRQFCCCWAIDTATKMPDGDLWWVQFSLAFAIKICLRGMPNGRLFCAHRGMLQWHADATLSFSQVVIFFMNCSIYFTLNAPAMS